MQENTLVKYTMTYGLYVGIAMSVVVLIYKMAGYIHSPGDTIGVVNATILALAILNIGRRYKERVHTGVFLYKNALGFSVLLTLFSSIIYAFFSYWYYARIEPDGITYYIQQVQAAYSQNGAFNEQQITTMVDLYKTILTPGLMAIFVFMAQITIGVLIGLVISAFLKSPAPINQNNFNN